jgi:hypothetical protein
MSASISISTIKNNNCIDIIKTMEMCINSTIESKSNMVSMQKNYLHPIYYPVDELKECVSFNRFIIKPVNGKKLNVGITDKMNTQLYYTVTYNIEHNNINLQL